MSVGNRIKERRKEIGLSVDELAYILNKNRATIYRYESDEIENLPVSIIEPLAKALRTTPAYLMGWQRDDSKHISVTDNNDAIYIEELTKQLNLLNTTGKEEAIKRVKELTYISMYCK